MKFDLNWKLCILANLVCLTVNWLLFGAGIALGVCFGGLWGYYQGRKDGAK